VLTRFRPGHDRAEDLPAEGATPGDGSLRVDKIDVLYGRIQALRGVSIEVRPGEMVALLGANGAGKTTTLRAISGLVPVSGGSIRFDGVELAGMPAHKVVGQGVAQLPEGRDLFPTLSVEENLRFGYYTRRKESGAYQEQLDYVMDVFPKLRERRKQAAGTLSGGEQQMLGAARALMSKPRLVMIDELSLGLAPLIVADLFAVLREVNGTGTSVLIVEQFVHLALRNTNRAYVLAKGEVVLEGRSDEMEHDPQLIEAYLGGGTAH